MVTISGSCSHIQKFSENGIYALAATRKTGCTKASTFTKSVMVSMGVSKLGRMVRNRTDFFDARVKINDA